MSWTAHEWLSFTILATSYRLAGFCGLYAYTAGVVSVIFGVLFWILLGRTRSPLISILLASGAALISTPFFLTRPQLATYLFSLITLAMLMGDRRNPRLWRLVPMFLLWANLHAGVLIGIGLIAVFAIADGAEYLARGEREA